MGFKEPTEIQKEAIPPIMKGKDVIGESATGSGKTLAFGCGIVDKVTQGAGIQALILTPTRELTLQVKEAIQKLSSKKKLNVVPVYGGVAIGPQIKDILKADVVVATPGRMLDHLERRTINTSKVKILILDEADRMFDMGFIEDVEQIIKACPKKRQTLFFSATISSNIRNLANKYMENPIRVSAEKMVDPKKLKQVYYDVPKNMKLSLLTHLLEEEKAGLVIVFCNTRRTTDFVVRNLQSNKIKAIAIHGGLAQNKRTKTMKIFNEGKVGVLVCTDVAARGLHIENVSHVYNYEIPKDAKDYVHRIGRTARAGEEGKAINLLCDYDHENFSRIRREYPIFSIERIEKPYVKMVIAKRIEEKRKPQIRPRLMQRHNRFEYRQREII
ncbi:DEAD/DEAH box helicase [Candidatus Woesearchaeota archaeon]|nr:DEAD/DEAH box helicase [Candidatus Woesearchaeota archaeon]